MEKYNTKRGKFLRSPMVWSKRLCFIAVCSISLLFKTNAQTIQYKGASDTLFATSDSRLVANVVEMGDSLKVEVLGVGYIRAGVLAFTLVYDTSKLTLVDKNFLNAIPFAPAVPGAVELSSSLPPGYGIDATQHDVIQGVTNMAYYKGGIYTSSYNFADYWKVPYGGVEKAITLFLKKKQPGTPVLSSDLGFYLSRLPKREPCWGIDALQVGYKYGSGTNIHRGGGVFMDYFNNNMFAFRWTSTVTTDEVTDIKRTTATLNGSFERSKFNPTQDAVTLVDNPHFSSSVTLPNTLLGWDTISRYGFIYSESDANIAFVPFSKKIKVDGMDYELTTADLTNGSFTANSKTFFLLSYNNSSDAQTVTFSGNLTNLQAETDYYAWAYMFYAFQTSDAYPAVGEKVFFTTLDCEEPSTPVGLAQQTVCIGATIANLQVSVNNNTELKWYQNGMELLLTEPLQNNEIYYAKAVNGVCISENALAVQVIINPGPQIAIAPASAYLAMGSQAFVIVTDNNPTNAKTISVANSAIASAVLIGDTIEVFGTMEGNTEITYTSVNEFGCEATFLIPVQVLGQNPTDLTANFHINLTEQCSTGNLFTFTDQSRITTPNGHTISGYLWNFGDGTISTLANPTHAYANAGIYTVTLTVTEAPTGTQSSTMQTVTVWEIPTVTIETPPALCEGGRLQIPMPTINWNGNTPTTGVWSLDGNIIDPLNTYVTAADNGKILQYILPTACGNVVASAGAITVIPAPSVSVASTVDVCADESFALLSCMLNNPQQGQTVSYNITFNASALQAGFSNVNGATLTGNTISIPLPNQLSADMYGATLTIEADGCANLTTHQFYIDVNESVRIAKQPESVIVCNEDGFTLSVTATGKQLTYQWYRNGLPITGATDSIYTVLVSDSTVDFGMYYAEVSGLCGSATSEMTEVSGGGLTLLVKWTDVIFIPNENNHFVAYQWYKDGKPIGKDGNYQSYMEEGGLDGTYYVMVTYADGTQAVSCPRTMQKPATSGKAVSIYPNPTQPYSEIMIDMSSYSIDEVKGAKLEIIDMLGQYVTGTTLTTTLQRVHLNVAQGIYTYRITTTTNEVIVGKILVHQK